MTNRQAILRREAHQNQNEVLGSAYFTVKFAPSFSLFSPLVLVTLRYRIALFVAWDL